MIFNLTLRLSELGRLGRAGKREAGKPIRAESSPATRLLPPPRMAGQLMDTEHLEKAIRRLTQWQ